MEDKLITVTIDSMWSNEADVKTFAAKMKYKFNITASFNDGGDYYSSWNLTGTKDNLIAAIMTDWSDDFDELSDMMTDIDYYKVFGKKKGINEI